VTPASRRLGGLDRESVNVAQKMLLQGDTGRHRPPEVVSPHPQPGAGHLNEALVRRLIDAEQDGRAGQAVPTDNRSLNATALR